VTDRYDLPFATGYHAPVLLGPTLDALVTETNGTYVDATLGGGGHSAALLERLGSDARVIGVDRDGEALAEATARLGNDRRFETRHGSFIDLESLVGEDGPLDGVLFDLGVSSHQIDEAGRGFSFRHDAPLDMRMDRTQPVSAATLVNEADEADLVRMLFVYGEEPRARRIVRALVAARPVETTGQLAEVVRAAVPRLDEAKSVTRVFQALRIAVNDELGALETALEACTRLVRRGGRVAVLSYHSLEDRRVKRFFRTGRFDETTPGRDVFGNSLAPFRDLTRQPVVAPEAEVAANPRARSARLRVAERL